MGKGCLRFPVGADRCVCPKKVPHNGWAHTPMTPLHLFVFLFYCLIVIFRRGRPMCLPEESTAQWQGAHTGAPLHLFVFLFLCLIVIFRRGRPMCLPEESTAQWLGTRRCAPTKVCITLPFP